MSYWNDEIVFKVREIVARVGDCDIEKAGADDSLINDIGLDSLDFLDLIFRLESAFNIRIKRGQIEKDARAMSEGENFEMGGVITPSGIEALKKSLPEVPPERFSAEMRVSDIPKLFTVMTFVRLVKSRLEADDDETLG